MATNTWSETAPLGTVAANTIETEFQKFRLDIRERIAVDHEMSSDDSGLTRLGGHKAVGLTVQGTAPTNVTDIGFIYAFDVSSKAELHWKDEDGNILKFTSAGNYTMTEAKNMILGTSTGSKWGTAVSQKQAWWNASPVVQPSHITDPTATATITFTHSWNGSTDPTLTEGNKIVTDLGTLKTAIDSNNTKIDAILAWQATLGLTASS